MPGLITGESMWTQEGVRLITDDLEFVRESFDSSATEGAEQTYKLRSQDLRIEKRTTSYISLNSIDGLTLAMHVNDWWWLNEYKSLFGDSWNDSYDEYEGSFDADTSTFTLDERDKLSPRLQRDRSRDSRKFYGR